MPSHITWCAPAQRHGIESHRRCISTEEYRPVEPVIRVRFPAAALPPLYLSGRAPVCGTGHPGSIPGRGTCVLHPANRPRGPKTSWTWHHKRGGLEGIEPPSLGPKPGIVPVDHNPTGGYTNPPPRQNGIRTRTNPVMLPCGIRTRGGFQFLTF